MNTNSSLLVILCLSFSALTNACSSATVPAHARYTEARLDDRTGGHPVRNLHLDPRHLSRH